MYGKDHFGQLCSRPKTNDNKKTEKPSKIGGSQGEEMAFDFIQQTFANISQQRKFANSGMSQLMAPPSRQNKHVENDSDNQSVESDEE
ncbi:unnamed protein product [Adineta ricciae]|nr:unnamed protein product [Adineta ricciae]